MKNIKKPSLQNRLKPKVIAKIEEISGSLTLPLLSHISLKKDNGNEQ